MKLIWKDLIHLNISLLVVYSFFKPYLWTSEGVPLPPLLSNLDSVYVGGRPWTTDIFNN